ncbi:uncharacterized protein LOC133031328 [Cannabis sativa]|uniref:uncharacterized protein LOC133031328 n=1 Tax=Cannabis sativa TaxID=3483 RepID=UPI0029CA5F9D|nr:uncharacterized protein LOC133031328 [Cannabis sativa]
MAQHNPISAMLHQPDKEFDSQSSSSSSDQEENSEENETCDESKDSDTSDDDVPPYFMAQSAEEAYSQPSLLSKVKMKVKKMKKKQLQRTQNPSITKRAKFVADEIYSSNALLNHRVPAKPQRKKTKFKTFKFLKHKGRKIKFLRKKRDFRKKSDRCFVCGKKGHYAKQCPKGKTVKLISHIQQTTGMSLKENDIESIFSTDDEFNSESLCAFEQWSDSDTPECYQMFTIHTMQPSSVLTVRVLPKKYAKPIKVAGFFDTGASYTIMNPDILPKEYWKKEKQYFHATNGGIFCTKLISKPIRLQFFPGCSVTHRVIGSKLPEKDLIVGFDLHTKKKGLRILPSGLGYIRHFAPWETIPNYFLMPHDPFHQIKKELIEVLCANNHAEFLKKCDHPLWKNQQFFISLPFKLNEDINPTKASHPGMNPEHQHMASNECKELEQQGLIEATSSPWACHEFYVNNRLEQARGKQRLVINYKPLNEFLADDKFPIPNKNSLFASLSKAHIFSKFDLKAGFWQLGIKPDGDPKQPFAFQIIISSGLSYHSGSKLPLPYSKRL